MSEQVVTRHDWESDDQFEARRQRIEDWWSTYLPDVQPQPAYAVVKPAEVDEESDKAEVVPKLERKPPTAAVDPRPAKYKRLVLNLAKEFVANGLPKWAAHLRRQVEDIEAGK